MSKPTKTQYQSTARFHERMARAIAEHGGKPANAKAAKRAAALCRASAERVRQEGVS